MNGINGSQANPAQLLQVQGAPNESSLVSAKSEVSEIQVRSAASPGLQIALEEDIPEGAWNMTPDAVLNMSLEDLQPKPRQREAKGQPDGESSASPRNWQRRYGLIVRSQMPPMAHESSGLAGAESLGAQQDRRMGFYGGSQMPSGDLDSKAMKFADNPSSAEKRRAIGPGGPKPPRAPGSKTDSKAQPAPRAVVASQGADVAAVAGRGVAGPPKLEQALDRRNQPLNGMFLEFCQRSLVGDNLDFLAAVDIAIADPTAATVRAVLDVVDSGLNFSHQNSRQLEAAALDGAPATYVGPFIACRQEILNLMSDDVFARFLRNNPGLAG